jgi:phage terminase small subunit
VALNSRQQAFVDAYAGNATEAARLAGYKGSAHALEVTGSRLLRHAEVRKAIAARNKPQQKKRIADRQERQQFWSDTMNDASVKPVDRLRASELLGRSEADFTEKVLVQGKLTLEQLVEAASS